MTDADRRKAEAGCVLVAAVLMLAMVAVLGLAGCRKAPAPTTAPGPRIVSFSPALTKILFDMGLGDQVVGVTSQDSLPPGESRPVVGDAFSVNTESVLAINPDIILTQVNPALFEGVARTAPHVRIEPVRIETLDDVALAMRRVARLAGHEQAGEVAAAEFEFRLNEVRRRVAGRDRPAVVFITDFELLGSAGQGTFIDQLIDLAGGRNVAGQYSGWVTLTLEGLIAAEPQVLICQVSPSQEVRVREFWSRHDQIPAVQAGRVHLVTDRAWTIPTADLATFAGRLAEMIHPDVATQEGSP